MKSKHECHSMLTFKSVKTRKAFEQQVKKIAGTKAVLGRAIAERADELFVPEANEICQEIKETYNMQNPRRII